jgi:NAD-dependent SIR2 family protein deacetylase
MFMKKIFEMKCLQMVYTQNIDSLELDAGIPLKKIIQAHGHMRSAHCCKCKMVLEIQTFYDCVLQDLIGYCHQCHPERSQARTGTLKLEPTDTCPSSSSTDENDIPEQEPVTTEEDQTNTGTKEVVAAVEETVVPDNNPSQRLPRASKTASLTSYASYFTDSPTKKPNSSSSSKHNKKSSTTTIGLIKPDIIFFGEKLPNLCISKLVVSDLIIVMGTSLKVKPFSELIKHIPDTVPIVVINRDLPKVIQDEHPYHLFLPGDIQETIQSTVDEIGWSINL